MGILNVTPDSFAASAPRQEGSWWAHYAQWLIARSGKRLDLAYELNLWETSDDPRRPGSIVAPLDPADYQFDPLLLM
jgi:poly(3-hydroxyalkanoate) synthetase